MADFGATLTGQDAPPQEADLLKHRGSFLLIDDALDLSHLTQNSETA